MERAIKSRIAIEMELGSLEGGEAELANVKIDQTGTGALILVPSVGNLHDSYIQSDGLKFNRDILKALHDKFRGHVSRCLHGTGESLDELFNERIKNGLNINSWARDPYTSPSHFPITSKPLSHLCRTIV
ncbi:hypothetical protein K435DRAFT_867296 [Dendrothele bispora CBS 962.96]|uniref:Fructose-bisphosphate aldolase n=1 Tax=Dendrothele bispora (strain CBS 962.96) TaxID=1314807 RepID=A0A4S8LFC5_DENBC|nr:hypothetical protein K435DRAFT_867296 [Dendrothele bispora CBS 962.96]